jgi:hypothetical protein
LYSLLPLQSLNQGYILSCSGKGLTVAIVVLVVVPIIIIIIIIIYWVCDEEVAKFV